MQRTSPPVRLVVEQWRVAEGPEDRQEGVVTQVEPYPRRARRSAEQGGQHGGQHGGPQSRPRGPASGARPRGSTPASGGTRRGRHATPLGQGFSWVTVWTIIGAIVPGSGLVAAGRRAFGGFLLALVGLVLAGTAVAFVLGDPVHSAISFAVDTRKLMIMALVVGVGALVWAGLIVLTHVELRRGAHLTGPQRAFSVVVVLALLGGLGLPAYKVGSYALIQRDLLDAVTAGGQDVGSGLNPDAEKADPWAGIPRMNVLLIGSDAGRGRIGVRPDTLILASIDTRSGNTVLFSLPRGLERAPFPIGSRGAQAWPDGFYCPNDECLLNAVWTWGDDQGRQYYTNEKNPGLKATQDVVEGVTGLKVDTYAMLNLKGFAEFVNAIGGLRLNVSQRLPIGGNSTNRTAVGGWLEAGPNQKLNGYQSLWYARSRWTTSDFDRMRRQRCVIGAVATQADPVKMALKFPEIAAAAKGNISTGIAKDDLQAWVELAQRIQKARVTSLPFTDEVIPDRTNPDFLHIQQLVNQALRKSMQAPKPKATAPAGTPATAGTSAGTSTPRPSTSKATGPDPTEAQDVKTVC
jgi:LCP family protein required for cell wall assembly